MDEHNDTTIEVLLEHLMEHGPSDIGTVFARAFEMAMQIERVLANVEAGRTARHDDTMASVRRTTLQLHKLTGWLVHGCAERSCRADAR